jgi:hypothetical protein
VNAKDRPVHGPGGQYGTVDTTCWPSLDEMPEPSVDVRLDDGRHVCVPTDAMIEQRDGSYYLTLTREELARQPAPTESDDGCWPCRHGAAPPPGQIGVGDHKLSDEG